MRDTQGLLQGSVLPVKREQQGGQGVGCPLLTIRSGWPAGPAQGQGHPGRAEGWAWQVPAVACLTPGWATGSLTFIMLLVFCPWDSFWTRISSMIGAADGGHVFAGHLHVMFTLLAKAST